LKSGTGKITIKRKQWALHHHFQLIFQSLHDHQYNTLKH
jgi:hypothetical protein